MHTSDTKPGHTQPKLIRGSEMICPRCKTWQSILAYMPLLQAKEYEHETAPIYKCSKCRWVFAPDPRTGSLGSD